MVVIRIKKDKLEIILFALLLIVFFGFVYRDFNPKSFDMCDVDPFVSSPEEWLNHFLSSWGYDQGGGTGAPLSVGPLALIHGFLTLLFDGPGLAQKVYWYSILPLSCISMYIFLRKIVSSTYARFLGSFVYAVNPFTIHQFLRGGVMITPFIFLPLVLLFLSNILEKKGGMTGNAFRLIFCVGLSTIFHAQSIVFFLPFMIILPLVFMMAKKDRRHVFRILLLLLAAAGFCFVTLLPTNMFYAFMHIFGFEVGERAVEVGIIRAWGGFSDPEELIAGLRGSFLRPSSPPNLVAFSVVAALLSFSAFFVRDKRRGKYVTSFLLVGILFIGFWGLSVMEFTYPLFFLFPPLKVLGSPQKLWGSLVPTYPLVLALLFDEAEETRIFHKIFQKISPKQENGWKLHRRHIFLMFLTSLILIPNFTYHLVPWDENPWEIFTAQEYFSEAELPSVYRQVYEWLEAHTDSEKEFFRILWLSSGVKLRDLRVFYPSTPAFHSPSNLSRFILTPFLEGRTREFGWMLALINVKYVVVNMLTTYEPTKPSISEYGGYLYASGDPEEFVKLLGIQEDLKIVANSTDFVIYENLDFTPHISVYDDFVLIPTFATAKALSPIYSMIPNAGFEDGNSYGWGRYLNETWRQSIWKVDNTTSRSGRYSFMGTATDIGGPARLYMPVEEDITYYISAWMKIENADGAHFKVYFLDENGDVVGDAYAEWEGHVASRGTRDWFSVSITETTPPGTREAEVWLCKGPSLDKENLGITWFDDIVFAPTDFYSLLTAIEWSENPEMALFYVCDLLSEISNFDLNTDLILSPLSNDTMKRFWDISKVAVYGGGIEPREETEYIHEQMLLFVFESEVYLSPVSGNWSRMEAPTLSNRMALNLTGSGRAKLEFFAPRDGYYRTIINMAVDGEVSVQIDNSVSVISGTDGKFEWYEASPSYLEQDSRTVTIDFRGNFMTIDRILVTSSKEENLSIQDMFDENQSLETEVIRISRTKYRIGIKSEKPVYIALSQSYHEEWKASLENGTELEHFPFLPYDWANGFYLAKNGEHIIEIKFAEQELRTMRLLLFSGTWSFVIVGILYTSNFIRSILRRAFRRAKKAIEERKFR